MKASDKLFALIKSLIKPGKRYFKIIASKKNEEGKSNNYLRLFNAIDKQDEYKRRKNHLIVHVFQIIAKPLTDGKIYGM